jgi:hypothetical protein
MRVCELARFLTTQRLVGFSIREEPHLDEESIPVFRSFLRDCKFYLEYGSGGSTVLAARLKKRFISVETDPYYLKSVHKKIGKLAPDQRLLYADVGLTGPWGTPLWRRLTPRRVARWTGCLEAPWHLVEPKERPDLILIDGRFRVAATLTCCLHLGDSSGAHILVDDYGDYPNYHVIEQYATLTATVGRMAIFQPAPSVSNQALRAAIAEYAQDLR